MVWIYESGTPRVDECQVTENSLCDHRLFSVHGSYQRSVQQWLEHPRNGVLNNLAKSRPSHILLDSGGFSAWRSGHPTTVEAVIQAYKKFLDVAKPYFKEIWMISLDQIPGKFGVDPTPEEIKSAIVESDKNYKILTDIFGDRILPIYHQGEDIERALEVEEQTAGKSNYICVSPRNDLPEAKRVVWSQQVHAKLKPTTRTHGLATTGNKMVSLVPWYSVDSATWILVGAMGSIIHFWDSGIKQGYSTIAITNDAGRDRYQNQHFDTYAKPFQDAIVERIESLGFTLEEVKTNVRPRSLYNMYNLELWMKQIREMKLSRTNKVSIQETLFGV